MKKLKIGTTLYITFATMIIYMLILAVGNYKIIQSTAETSNTLYNNYGKIQGDVAMAYSYFQEVKVDLRNVLYIYIHDDSKKATAIEAIETAENNMETYFDMAEKVFIDDDIIAQYNTAHDNIDAYLSDVDTCLSYVSQNKVSEAREHLNNYGIDSANAAADAIDELIEKIQTHASEELVTQNKSIEVGKNAVGIFLAAIVIITILTARALIKLLCNPIVEIAEIAKKISVGDVSQNIEKPDTIKNEISILQNSFCDMIDNLKAQSVALNKLSEGNLDIEYNAVSDKDVVGKAIERLIKDDNAAFGVIRNATNQISIGSGQIAAASQTLAQGSTQQASAIQQIAASITDIANKTKDNATQANEVNNIVVEAKGDINQGNARMQEMVSAMREINEASENIQKIIKVIDDIAFNTNILALNATVEAARAGEQGKGFAVVAEEVRNLAGRSAEASSQTAEMIEDSIVKVRRGSELAEETAKSLGVISDMIDKITGLSADIATASNDQATATAQIDQALSQVSQVVQTNSATSQQCASASEELSGQARGLEREISRFKLKDVIGTAPSHTLEYEEPMRISSNVGKY